MPKVKMPNALVIARSVATKQSKVLRRDCFASLAMTVEFKF
jgi:hypothetical protein